MAECPDRKDAPAPAVFDIYTEELLQKIKEDKVTIDPTVWSLLTHVLGNRTYAISLNLGDLLDTPKWILRAGSCVMTFLHKISGRSAGAYDIEGRLRRALNNTKMIGIFLRRLRESAEEKKGF